MKPSEATVENFLALLYPVKLCFVWTLFTALHVIKSLALAEHGEIRVSCKLLLHENLLLSF